MNTPLKTYKTILVDSPWETVSGGRGSAKNHYGTMATPDIMKIPVMNLAHEDGCVLIAWGMWAMTFDFVLTVTAWGFFIKTGFPWIKTLEDPTFDLWGNFDVRLTYGTGHWVRGNTEPVLIARRGKAPCPHSNALGIIWDYDMFLVARRSRTHSRKPDDIYTYAEQFAGPHLEMFARENEERPDHYDVFGDQVPGTISLDSYEYPTKERGFYLEEATRFHSIFGKEGAAQRYLKTHESD